MQKRVGVQAREWLGQKEWSVRRSTWNDYRSVVEYHIVPIIGDVPIRRLTRQHVARLLQTTSEGRRRRVIGVLRQILGPHSALDVRVSVKPKRRLTIPSPDEARLIAKAAGHHEAFVLAAAYSGLRQSELAGLNKTDVDWDRRMFHVDKSWLIKEKRMGEPKTRAAYRDAMFHAALLPQLEKHTQHLEKQVFVAPRGGRVDTDNFNRNVWKPAVRQVGLEHYRFHDLRHTYATMLINARIAPALVSRMLGHSKTSTTLDVYAGWWPDEYDRLAVALGGGVTAIQ